MRIHREYYNAGQQGGYGQDAGYYGDGRGGKFTELFHGVNSDLFQDMKTSTTVTNTTTRAPLLPVSSPTMDRKGMTAKESVGVMIQRKTLRPLATSP
jgi:hypothetical protein